MIISRMKNRILLDLLTQYEYFKNCRLYKTVASPLKTINVRLTDIRLKLYNSKLPDGILPGSIIDGNWDLRATDLMLDYDQNEKFQGIVEHFEKNIPWEQTVLFKKRYAHLLEERGTFLGCTSLKEIARKYENKIDPLYEKIKKNGIIPRSLKNPFIEPIYLHIGRNGDFIFTTGGNHRLTIAKILGIEFIPVRIWIRHIYWQNTRDRLHELLSTSTEDSFISMLKNHPDLQDILSRFNRY